MLTSLSCPVSRGRSRSRIQAPVVDFGPTSPLVLATPPCAVDLKSRCPANFTWSTQSSRSSNLHTTSRCIQPYQHKAVPSKRDWSLTKENSPRRPLGIEAPRTSKTRHIKAAKFILRAPTLFLKHTRRIPDEGKSFIVFKVATKSYIRTYEYNTKKFSDTKSHLSWPRRPHL